MKSKIIIWCRNRFNSDEFINESYEYHNCTMCFSQTRKEEWQAYSERSNFNLSANFDESKGLFISSIVDKERLLEEIMRTFK